jgi:methylated-DNA-[protein]-cysteine S-methyltransferase
VYALCAVIPKGRVANYGALAAALGCGSARAVGQAMRRNPFAPAPVPCHRVIGSSRDIGGFHGDASPCCAGGHVRRKRSMLRAEGVSFESEKEEEEEDGKGGGGGGGQRYWRVSAASMLSLAETRALKPAALDFGTLVVALQAKDAAQ